MPMPMPMRVGKYLVWFGLNGSSGGWLSSGGPPREQLLLLDVRLEHLLTERNGRGEDVGGSVAS